MGDPAARRQSIGVIVAGSMARTRDEIAMSVSRFAEIYRPEDDVEPGRPAHRGKRMHEQPVIAAFREMKTVQIITYEYIARDKAGLDQKIFNLVRPDVIQDGKS